MVKQFIVPTLRPEFIRGPIKIVQCLLIITQSNFSLWFWFIQWCMMGHAQHTSKYQAHCTDQMQLKFLCSFTMTYQGS